jgi:hypothetical protein
MTATLQTLRADTEQRLATMVDEAELAAVNRFLKRLEMLRLRRAIGEAVDSADASGLWATVEESVQEFRRKQAAR